MNPMPFNLSEYTSVPPYRIQAPDNFSIAQYGSLSRNSFLLSNLYAQIFEMIHLSHLFLDIEIWKLALEFTVMYSILDILIGPNYDTVR
jgi:hypothetical protein